MALIACAPQMQPLPEAGFRALMDYDIAQEIVQNCPKFIVAPGRAPNEALVNALMDVGKTAADAKRLMEISKSTFGEKYKIAYANVVPVNPLAPQYHCKYGEYERARHSAVGNLLEFKA